MAEAIIASVVRKLGDMAATEIESLLGLKKELDNLFSEFSAIKRVLQDAETRQINDKSVRGWLQNLKYVAYDLDDLLEEWRILREVDAVTTSPFINCFGDQVIPFINCLFHFTNCFGNSSCSNLTSLIKHPFRHLKYRQRVDEIKSRLEQITREKERYRFSDDSPVRRMREERRTDSWVNQTSVIGRDEDKKTLVSKLISEEGSVTCGSGSDKVPTIFISGMGGLGKTTLAKSVFNDERVKEKFGDKRMWVYVGKVSNREDIMKSMIERLGESVMLSWREQLAEMLKDRKYLLILDDVWNEDYLEWEKLEEILNQGAKGSKIVITTRNTGVVDKIRSDYTHKLTRLNEDQCLSIFKKVVIEPGMEEVYEPLMDIGKQIVGKCGGLPLAVKTVASTIRGKQPTREQWEMVRNSKIWVKDSNQRQESDEGILHALMLSYTELTPQLKNCFSYCSLFEKGTLLKKDELISLWVSQGYIREEEVGEKHFEELLACSMFQELERDDDGTITCKMHDLVHVLAQWVTKEECRIIGNDNANNNNNSLSQLAGARHCIVRREVSIGDINLAGVEKLRTLIFHCYGSTPEPIDTVLKSLKSVRVLKLRNCSVDCHSWEHLGKLVHLRHLELSGTALTQLPAESIASLKELRYLDLSDSCIKTLPENIGTLSSLRQLNVSSCSSLVNLPKTIVSLPHLQVIKLKHCSGLEELPELKDLLSLRQLNVSRCTSLVNLPKTIISLPHLQEINLEHCSGLEELLELNDLLSLRQLNVSSCDSLVNLPKTIVSLPHLQVINLSNCSGLEELPELMDLPSLRELNVEGCTSLVNLPKAIVSLPHLQVINLEGCSGLEELSELKDLSCLRHLNVSWCTSIVNLPKTIVSLPHLQVINLSNCSGLKELPELMDLPSLRELNVKGCTSLVNLPKTIVSLPHLQVINLRNCSGLEELPELMDLPSLRELNVEGCKSLVNLPKTIVSLPHLQVINLEGCSRLEELPELMGLSSLKQLNVGRCVSLVNLPRTIISLSHLQVINLKDCFSLKELPEGILEMTGLRQLNVEGCLELEKLPNGIGRREDVVVTLNIFKVGDGGGGCSRSNIGELGAVNVHIARGCLHIVNLEKVGSRDEARTAKLEERTSLTRLTLYWNDLYWVDLYWNDMDDVIAAAAGVLEGLRPPPHLLSLEIENYPGQTFPSWMCDGGAAFRHLREVELRDCNNCNQLPPLGQLPSLESLYIRGLDGVERVGREFFGGPSPTFPCLKYLSFRDMRNWSEWVALSPISSEAKEGSAESPIMPALESLEFFDCPKLEAMPPIFTTSLRRLTVDDSSPMLYHRGILQFLPHYETIAIVVDAWNAKSTEDADDPLICVVIATTATELLGSLLLHQTALRMLILADLALLRSLPEELTQLTALQQLIIRNCPELSGRCRVGGELWPKIAHIPLIRIDGQDIRSA